ncbi:MAG: hypothetical protein FWH53_00510 [Leptospirales bacterium]|nr:hypothetical protein [Leptospirales bacterium]
MAKITKNYGREFMIISNGTTNVVTDVTIDYRDGQSEIVDILPGTAIQLRGVENLTAEESVFGELNISTHMRMEGFFLH